MPSDYHPVTTSVASAQAGLLYSLFLAFALFFLYSFFVLASAAIMRARGKRVRELGRAGTPGARFAHVILMRSTHYLLTCQVGMFATAMTAGYFLMQAANAELFDTIVGLFLTPSGQLFAAARLICSILFIGAAVLCGLVIVQIGKAVAMHIPERVLCAISFAVILTNRLIRPIVHTLSWLANRIVLASGATLPVEQAPSISAEEISDMVDRSSDAGEIEDDEREMIQGVFALSEKVVYDVMTPRKSVVFVHDDSTLEQVVETFVAQGMSRILVVGETLDEVRGLLLSKDLIPYVGKPQPEFELKRLLRPAYFVPSSKNVGDLLEEFRANAMHFAVVVDEHGGVDGVVTVEDLLEEIVGEIFDEFDTPTEEGGAVLRARSGDLLIEGTTPIDTLNENFELDFPRGDYQTIAGFVMHTLGRMPDLGEVIEHGRYRIRVERIVENRVGLLRLLHQRRTSDLRVVDTPPAAVKTSANPKSSNKVAAPIKARISGSR